MAADDEQPVTYRLVSDHRARQVQAVCSCGWRSQWLSSAGMAGASWDQHRTEMHRNGNRSDESCGSYEADTTDVSLGGHDATTTSLRLERGLLVLTCQCGWASTPGRASNIGPAWDRHIAAINGFWSGELSRLDERALTSVSP